MKAPRQMRGVRPLTDRAREALFNILTPRIAEATFLDLFAGTGAVGIEALSRGAKIAFFVELNRAVVNLIRQNLELTKLTAEAEVYNLDVLKALAIFDKQQASFDLVYIGAPYDNPILTKVLSKISNVSLVKPGGIMIVEHRKQSSLEPQYGQLALFREARYGETALAFYKGKS